MIAPVSYQSLPSRVVFGKGAIAQAGELMAELGASRILVIAARSQAGTADQLLRILGPVAAARFDRAAMHTPVEVTQEAMRLVEAERIDGLLAVGGGSAIGLSKAIALRTDLPQLVIPTTYAGSEMTPVVGQTEAGRKTTQRTPKVLPEAVIYDVGLTLALPLSISVTSGFNAMAHAVEALYAKAPNPLLSAIAEDCVRGMAGGLPRIARDGADETARSDALAAAWQGGWALANGGSALHHRLCHILGGAYGLPHAETHTILLPHVLAFNAPAAPDAMLRLGRALATASPAAALFDLGQDLGAPAALKDIGMPEDGIAAAVQILMSEPVWNPRPLEPEVLIQLILGAWRGRRPD